MTSAGSGAQGLPPVVWQVPGPGAVRDSGPERESPVGGAVGAGAKAVWVLGISKAVADYLQELAKPGRGCGGSVRTQKTEGLVPAGLMLLITC